MLLSSRALTPTIPRLSARGLLSSFTSSNLGCHLNSLWHLRCVATGDVLEISEGSSPGTLATLTCVQGGLDESGMGRLYFSMLAHAARPALHLQSVDGQKYSQDMQWS